MDVLYFEDLETEEEPEIHMCQAIREIYEGLALRDTLIAVMTLQKALIVHMDTMHVVEETMFPIEEAIIEYLTAILEIYKKRYGSIPSLKSTADKRHRGGSKKTPSPVTLVLPATAHKPIACRLPVSYCRSPSSSPASIR